MTQSTALVGDGKDVQFTDREVPWMKLGKVIGGSGEAPPTAKEAAKLGGLDFQVELQDLHFGEPHTEPDMNGVQGLTHITNRKAVVRQDNSDLLGIVSAGYPVLQYDEAFDFMDTVAGEGSEGARYVAAGALRGGRQGFMVVRAPQAMQLNILDGKDPHDIFLALRTSHDLTRAIEVMAMPLRGKCMNQMTLSTFSNNVPHKWSVRHTSTMKAKLEEAQLSLMKLGAYTARFNELAQRLSAIKVTDEKAKYVLQTVISNRPKKDEVIDTIVSKMHSSPTVGWDGTGWGLVNAVSDYYEWGRSGGKPESRFLAALEGQTHKAINKTALILLRGAK